MDFHGLTVKSGQEEILDTTFARAAYYLEPQLLVYIVLCTCEPLPTRITAGDGILCGKYLL